ncbi:unnamed protein product [marine sediment metagenome]|uniref:Uncharacterized protein n=1 Tax=marine sediment metagenome TaxID=412755 RepID=X1KBS6_9ZZZZ
MKKGRIGSEENEEEQEVEASSHRHQVSLRIKEAWRRTLTTNLYTPDAQAIPGAERELHPGFDTSKS